MSNILSTYNTIFRAKSKLNPELVTSLVNGTTYPYETADISANNINSAVNISSNGSIYDNAMNLTVVSGDKFRLKFNFVLNSGQSPNVLIMANGDSIAGTSSNVIQPTTGSYDVVLTIIPAGEGVGRELTIYNTAASDWEMTIISMKKIL